MSEWTFVTTMTTMVQCPCGRRVSGNHADVEARRRGWRKNKRGIWLCPVHIR